MDMNETLKKVLTLVVVFVIIVLVALLLMVLITYILKFAEDITNTQGIIQASAILVGSMIIGAAIFVKK